MPPPWFTVGALTVGVILSIGSFFYTRYRQRNNYDENNYRRRTPPPEPSQRGRNLTCPICGQRILRNYHELQCGHRFHRNCYADRLLESRSEDGMHHLPCLICGEAPNRLSESNDHLRLRNIGTPSNSGASATEGLSDRRGKCSYCSRLLTPNERVQLDCGHYAHSICREHCQELQQCSNCLVNQTGSSGCSLCQMPIESSDNNLKRMECGHIIHQSCTSIARFTVCANCPQMEGAPLD